MKKFLTRLLLFFLPILILLYPMDYLLSKSLKKSNHYPGEFEVWTDIYSGKIDADIAIYGSSRAWVHMDSKLMEDSLHMGVYNFGLDGHNFQLQYLRHLEYFRCNKHPRLIIVSVDIFSLQKRVDLYQADQFLPYMLWNKNIHDFTHRYIGYKKYDYYVPLVRYSSSYEAITTALKDFVHAPSPKYRFKGYKGMDQTWNSDFDIAKATMKDYEIKLDTADMNLFERFLNECKAMNVDVIFVYCPEYIDGQKFVRNRKEIMDLYDSYARRHQLRFLDYSADEISFRKDLFYNTGHMNHKGSELFTNKLVHDLERIGIGR